MSEPRTTPAERKRFAIAVSFPGEHRRFVRNVVERLAEVLGRERVFYDEWYEAELLGQNGDLKLRRYYREQAEMVVPFFSEHYEKPWCEIEWHAIRAMLYARRSDDAVVPVQMDGTRVEGWESIDFAIRRKRRSGREIADLLIAAYRHRHPEDAAVDNTESDSESLATQTPAFESDETRALSLDLDEALARKLELTSRGDDTTAAVEEILRIKRRLREGGQLQAGDVLGERFQLLERVGRGGFATVWKAADREHHDVVAVKVLHGQYRHDRTRRERFFRGAREMAALRHPGIVGVLENHFEDGGWHFFVMEYLPGGDLRRVVRSKSLDVETCLEAVLQIGDALAYAHDHGVVHRDVKPANVLLDGAGRPKLTDFDLVRAADTTGGTRTGMLGTVIFAAPEMLGAAKDAGPSADVYGLGMTAAFALHGDELPFAALQNASAFVRSLEGPAAVLDSIQRAVSLEPAERPAAADFCSQLRVALAPVVPASPRRRQRRPKPSARFESEMPPANAETGDEWQNPVDGSILVYVPGGDYTLGSDEITGDEEPVHRVRLNPFWIAKYPVTNVQYRRFLEAEPEREKPELWEDKDFNQDRQPVVGVSWDEAVAYCEWAGLELSSEAQWEAAARGTDQRRFPWGNENPTSDTANFNDQKGGTTAVDFYPAGAGPFGTLDQAGNVWEWCSDVWEEDAYSGRDGQTDPFHEQGNASLRVVRGGSWLNPVRFLRAAYRGGRGRVGGRSRFLGFRCVFRSPAEH